MSMFEQKHLAKDEKIINSYSSMIDNIYQILSTGGSSEPTKPIADHNGLQKSLEAYNAILKILKGKSCSLSKTESKSQSTIQAKLFKILDFGFTYNQQKELEKNIEAISSNKNNKERLLNFFKNARNQRELWKIIYSQLKPMEICELILKLKSKKIIMCASQEEKTKPEPRNEIKSTQFESFFFQVASIFFPNSQQLRKELKQNFEICFHQKRKQIIEELNIFKQFGQLSQKSKSSTQSEKISFTDKVSYDAVSKIADNRFIVNERKNLLASSNEKLKPELKLESETVSNLLKQQQEANRSRQNQMLLQRDYEELKIKVESLKTQLAESHHKLNQKFVKLTNMKSIQQEKQAFAATNIYLKKELEEKSLELESLRKNMTCQLQDMKLPLIQLQRKNNELQTVLTTKDRQISKFKSTLTKDDVIKADLTSKLGDQESRIDQLNSNITNLIEKYKADESAFTSSIDSLKKKVVNLESENQSLVSSAGRVEITQQMQENDQQVKLQQLRQIAQKDDKINHFQSLSTQLQITVQRLEQKYIESQNSLKEVEKKNAEMAAKLLKNQTQYKFHISQNEELVKKLKEQIHAGKEKEEFDQQHLKRLTEQQKEMSAKLSTQGQEINQLKENIQTLARQKKNIQELHQTLQADYELLKAESSFFNDNKLDITQMEEQIRKSRANQESQANQISKLKSQIKQLERELITKNEEFNKLLALNEQNIKKSTSLNMKAKNFPIGKIPAELRQEIKREIQEEIRKQTQRTYEQQLTLMKDNYTQLYQQKYANLINISSFEQFNKMGLLYIDQLFQDELLQERLDYKFRILYHIFNLTNRIVLKSRLVYKLDLKNKANFHEYIDKVSNILCVAKTLKGTYIAGYYSGEYADTIMIEPGLLISVTNNESYVLNVPDHNSKSSTVYRGMVYDPYFLIFGNAELRIRAGEKSVFCNFGIMNSYYNHRGKKVHDFLCAETTRDADLESYQIYELTLGVAQSFHGHSFWGGK